MSFIPRSKVALVWLAERIMAAERKPLPRLVVGDVKVLPGESVVAARARIKAEKTRREQEQDRRERAQQESRLLREHAKEQGWVHPQSKKKPRRKRIKVLQGGRPESNKRRH